jgi:hypothetical protein
MGSRLLDSTTRWSSTSSNVKSKRSLEHGVHVLKLFC